jgi:NAD(P)H dehydrogenase (quinone)
MEKFLVTGASGELGSEIVNLLMSVVPATNLSVLVRDPSKVEDLKKKGVTVNQGDYNDYNSLVNAFRGIDKLMFVSSNDLKNRLTQHEKVIKAATEAKVKHMVFTSFQWKNETESSPIFFLSGEYIQSEKLIKASGLTYTILKNGLYTDFLPALLGEKLLETGTIYLPAGNGKAAFTLRSDLAAGAVAILTGKGHENKTYEFCADKAYTFNDIAAVLTKVTGKSIRYVSPPVEEYKRVLLEAGAPEGFVNMLAGSAEAIKQGEFEKTDQTLAHFIGRECTDLETFFTNTYKINTKMAAHEN